MSDLTTYRERDCLLAALELFRGIDMPRGLTVLVLFLYVCENEGLNVSELARAGGLGVASTARLVKTLAGLATSDPLPREQVLFELRSTQEDKRLRVVYLSERGCAIRDELERLIARAHPIRLPEEIAAAAA